MPSAIPQITQQTNEFIQLIDSQPIVIENWDDKYRYKRPDGTSDEKNRFDTNRRATAGVYSLDPSLEHRNLAQLYMDSLIFCPGGRIVAGAGTEKLVTLINCYVSSDIPDSMDGIMDCLKEAALTQQQGGGIGMNFSTLRPRYAIVKRTSSISTGVIPFMDMWHAMCGTIKSSGSRRGAMMGVLADWHPDIIEFITAKQKDGKLTNFNVSVLVSDALMRAVANDLSWDLGFHIPPAKSEMIVDKYKVDDKDWYVYKRMRARELWDMITQNTYKWAEPGVIFIDRINKMNNLAYCETITATNPCGEQPLPPNGDCDLAHLNVAMLALKPFQQDASFDMATFKSASHELVRFLDNVLDVTNYPLEVQKKEALSKRRIGAGLTGKGTLFQFLRLRYGSKECIQFNELLMRMYRDELYRASVELAKERGPFPLFDKDKFLAAPFVKQLPEDIRQGIAEHGIRNGVLMTMAPVGTGSIYQGNVSSGEEPSIAWVYYRKVLQPDGSKKEYPIEDFGYQVFKRTFPGQVKEERDEATGEIRITGLPDYMVTATELTVDEHLNTMASTQKYIDAAISKTINCPPDMNFEDFQKVYTRAYELGLKGCTTYRPSDVRGSVISTTSSEKPVETFKKNFVRPEALESKTYKIQWPESRNAFYVTISDVTAEDGTKRPLEIFINSKSVQHLEWITALSRTISAVFRNAHMVGGDASFLVEELTQVYSPTGGRFVDGEFISSLVAMIGRVIGKHIGYSNGHSEPETQEIGRLVEATKTAAVEKKPTGEICGQCNKPTLVRSEGCKKCTYCGYSTCG